MNFLFGWYRQSLLHQCFSSCLLKLCYNFSAFWTKNFQEHVLIHSSKDSKEQSNSIAISSFMYIRCFSKWSFNSLTAHWLSQFTKIFLIKKFLKINSNRFIRKFLNAIFEKILSSQTLRTLRTSFFFLIKKKITVFSGNWLN